MKNLSLLSVAISVVFCPLFYISCDEDENKLPAITMEGRNTFGCLANGKLFTSKAPLGQPGVHAELATNRQDTTEITIYAGNYSTDQALSISFYDSPTLQVDKIYNLNNSKFQVRYTEYGNAIPCTFESVKKGYIQLIKFDLNNNIIAGTFEFDLLSIDCNREINISEGRFDISEVIH